LKINLLLYSHDWFPLMGGIQTITMDLASGLVRESMINPENAADVTLVTQTPAAGMNDAALPFPVIRRPSKRNLVRLFRAADIVHLAGPSLLPLTLGYLIRKPIVLEHHGYQSICPNGLLLYEPDRSVCPGHFMARNYMACVRCNAGGLGWLGSVRSMALTFPRRWLARQVTANIAVSRHIAMRTALPHTQVIYHGVPEPKVADAVPSRGGEEPPFCFAYVGRLVHEKGVAVLLRAASRLVRQRYRFEVKIVGDGAQRAELEKLSEDLGLQSCTRFLGAVPVESVSEVLGTAQVVVMPSVWEDVAPLVAIEQMMHGRLVIASDIGGLGETVNDSGLKFQPGDDAMLAERMRWVLEDPSRAREIGLKAREIALKQFTVSRMVEQHLQLYQSLLRR
jgi:glycosyltransferase involved in cell wall biosynthesis